MSPEVFVIVFILAIPTYYVCRWVMKRLRITNDQNRKYLAILPTLVFTPIIYAGLVVTWIFSVSYYPESDFNQSEWELNMEERYKMSEDIIESELLLGKSRDEVVKLLGSDFSTYGENHIAYYLGFVPGLFNIDPDFLDIYFENGKVIKVSQHES